MTNSRTLHILYMTEQSPATAQKIQGQIERLGYTVELAHDGEETLHHCRIHPYDAVIIDQTTPSPSGLGIIRTLATWKKAPPVLIATRPDDEETAAAGLKLGASDYIIQDAAGYTDDNELFPLILERALRHRQCQLQQRSTELDALNAVTASLSPHIALPDVLNQALTCIVQTLEFESGLIGLPDERTGNLLLADHAGLPESLLEHLRTHGLNDTLCALAYREKKALGIENLAGGTEPGIQPEATILLEAGVESYVGAPILHRNRALGTLCLFNTQPRPITQRESDLLITIGQQIGAAVENARLFEELDREREIAQTLLDTAEAMSTTLQLDRLLERVLDEFQRIVPYDSASISLLPDRSLPRIGKAPGSTPIAWLVASRGLEHVPAAQREFILNEFPLVHRVLETWKPVIVSDTHQEPDWIPVEGLGMVRSWLGIPLMFRERAIGLLMVDSHQVRAYDQETARVAFAFAHQAALAIENSRLYGQTRAQLREALLLHSVTAALSSTLDTDMMLPYVCRSLCEILNGSSATIYSLDEQINTITAVANYAASSASKREQETSPGHSHTLSELPATALALAQRRPTQMHVNDPEADPRERAMLVVHGAQAVLLLPMVAHGRAAGLAAVWESQSLRRFTEGEIAIGQTLTHQAAVAMENARLFAETQKSAQQIAALYETSRALASSLETESLIHTILDAVYRTLGCEHALIATGNEETNTIGIRHTIWRGKFDAFPEQIQSVEYPLDHPDILADVYHSGRTEIIDGWDERFDHQIWENLSGSNGRDRFLHIFMPIKMRDHVIGVVEAGYEKDEKSYISDDDIQMLTAFMDQAAVALENARLFEEVGKRARDLEEANSRLQEMDRLKDQFLASVSHELRTPLNSIIGFSDVLLKEWMGGLNPKQGECVQNILISAEDLLALINDILDLSKIAAGRMTIEPTTFLVPDMVAEVRTTITPLIEKKTQTFELTLDDALPPLTADRIRTKQVLLNLLSNANKFTPDEGQITLACHLHNPSTIIFSVTDTGIGIRPEDQEIIFQEFRQADGALALKAKGTGLGLAISKRLVEMQQGHIWVESDYGHGATFSFTLPLNDVPTASQRYPTGREA